GNGALQFLGEILPEGGNSAQQNMLRYQAVRGDGEAAMHAAFSLCPMSDDASATKSTGGSAGAVVSINGSTVKSVQGNGPRESNKKYSSITRAIFGKAEKILPTDLLDDVIQGYMGDNVLLCERWAKTFHALENQEKDLGFRAV